LATFLIEQYDYPALGADLDKHVVYMADDSWTIVLSNAWLQD